MKRENPVSEYLEVSIIEGWTKASTPGHAKLSFTVAI
jgi:hypothetical protein